MGSSNDSSGGFDISIINKINEKIDDVSSLNDARRSRHSVASKLEFSVTRLQASTSTPFDVEALKIFCVGCKKVIKVTS